MILAWVNLILSRPSLGLNLPDICLTSPVLVLLIYVLILYLMIVFIDYWIKQGWFQAELNLFSNLTQYPWSGSFQRVRFNFFNFFVKHLNVLVLTSNICSVFEVQDPGCCTVSIKHVIRARAKNKLTHRENRMSTVPCSLMNRDRWTRVCFLQEIESCLFHPVE